MVDDLTDAVNRQRQRAEASMTVSRIGWTDEEWIADADRLMNEEDGAVTSLVNGHVLALLRKVAQLEAERDTLKAMIFALSKEIDRLREALEEYGAHDLECETRSDGEFPCDCGFYEALNKADTK